MEAPIAPTVWFGLPSDLMSGARLQGHTVNLGVCVHARLLAGHKSSYRKQSEIQHRLCYPFRPPSDWAERPMEPASRGPSISGVVTLRRRCFPGYRNGERATPAPVQDQPIDQSSICRPEPGPPTSLIRTLAVPTTRAPPGSGTVAVSSTIRSAGLVGEQQITPASPPAQRSYPATPGSCAPPIATDSPDRSVGGAGPFQRRFRSLRGIDTCPKMLNEESCDGPSPMVIRAGARGLVY